MKTEVIEKIGKGLKNANMIYIIGNGGSAATADHLAADLLKNCDLPAISLCSNLALITAIANDISFSQIFAEQLRVLTKEGDVLVAFSTRGTSLNIVAAAKFIYNSGGTVIGVAGYDGGELKKWSNIFYSIDSSNMQECEDETNQICHEIYKELLRYNIG